MAASQIGIEQLDQKLDLVLEHLKLHDQRFNENEKRLDRLSDDMKTVRHDMDGVRSELKNVRDDIAELQQTRLTWSYGILGGVTVASALLVIILSRLLNLIGLRLVDVGELAILG